MRLLPRMAPGRRRQPRRRAGRAARRGTPVTRQPRPPHPRIWAEEELDAAWAVRPLALGQERGRPMLMLEDPGGEPLDRLRGAPLATGRFLRLAVGLAAALGKLHQAWTRPQGHQAVAHPGGLHRRTSASHRLRHRLAPAPRAAGPRTARVHCRHPRLHGARQTADESFIRCPQRSLRFGRQPSTRCSPAHCRSPPPIPWNGSTAISGQPVPPRALGGRRPPLFSHRA